MSTSTRDIQIMILISIEKTDENLVAPSRECKAQESVLAMPAFILEQTGWLAGGLIFFFMHFRAKISRYICLASLAGYTIISDPRRELLRSLTLTHTIIGVSVRGL